MRYRFFFLHLNEQIVGYILDTQTMTVTRPEFVEPDYDGWQLKQECARLNGGLLHRDDARSYFTISTD